MCVIAWDLIIPDIGESYHQEKSRYNIYAK